MDAKTRCAWSLKTDKYIDYHDKEWGVPVRDDRGQFEFLTLEAAQAGLSWLTILNKREGYRRCFAEFDPVKVAGFTEKDVERLLLDPSIVRNRKKIESTISNARCFLEVAAKHGSFSNFIWGFTGGETVQNKWRSLTQIPTSTPLSDTISKELKKLGFKFLGTTVVYAHMQATGLVNDHLADCFRHSELKSVH